MKKFVVIIFALVLARAVSVRGDDNFKWQDAAREMDALPFSQTYIDSVRKEHLGSSNRQHGLRTVKPGSFVNGETLVYEGSWTVFNAGYLILSARRVPSQNAIRLGAKVMTNNVVSAIYRVRNYMISWVDANGLYPVFHENHAREGKRYRMDSYIVYDHINGKLHFQRRAFETFDNVPQFTHDYLSLLYYARSLDLKPGMTYSANLWTAPKSNPMTFKVHDKRETIKTPAGTFTCLRVEPRLTGDGRVYGRRDKIEIWITDDEHKIPVQVKSKAKIGSINVRLLRRTN